MASWKLDIISQESHPQHRSCWLSWLSYKFNLLLVEEFFLAHLWRLIDILHLLLSDKGCTPHNPPHPPPPHVERFHWFIWPTPSTTLMGLADSSSLPFKIYVPTRWAINHGTCSVGSELRQEARSRPIHYRGFGSTSEPHPHDWLEEHQQDWLGCIG